MPTFHSASTFHDAEQQAIIDALKATPRIADAGGTAARLKRKRTTLQNKMRRLNRLKFRLVAAGK